MSWRLEIRWCVACCRVLCQSTDAGSHPFARAPNNDHVIVTAPGNLARPSMLRAWNRRLARRRLARVQVCQVKPFRAAGSETELAGNNAPSNESLHPSQSTMSSDVDMPTAMNSVKCYYRNGTKRYRCQCGGETERIGDMKRHLKSGNHLSPQFDCVCGRRFTRKDGRKSHQKKCREFEAQDASST